MPQESLLVLVADDEPSMREVVVITCASSGLPLDVIVAENGEGGARARALHGCPTWSCST